MNPTIVIATFNRHQSLKRLLKNLSKASYPANINIPLIISIDGGPNQAEECVNISKEFQWPYGEKKLRIFSYNLGLRKHLLSCGDLTQEYNDGIILFEDDIIPGPQFYNYIIDTSNSLVSNKNIAGISLYRFRTNFLNNMPFEPVINDSKGFLMQIPCSWGEYWSPQMWKNFKNWYDINMDKPLSNKLPLAVRNWPNSSWLKYFYSFLIESNNYFYYPLNSYVTNGCEMGTHVKSLNRLHSTNICLNYEKAPEINVDTLIQYDSFFELTPESIKKLIPSFNYEFNVNLWGLKSEVNLIHEKTLVFDKNIKGWGINLRPLELNILLDNSGHGIGFVENKLYKKTDKVDEFILHYWSIPFALTLRLVFRKIHFHLKRLVSK